MQGAVIKLDKLLPLIAAQDSTFGKFCEKAGLSRRYQNMIRNAKPIRNLDIVITIGKALGLEGAEQYEKVFEWKELNEQPQEGSSDEEEEEEEDQERRQRKWKRTKIMS